MDLIKKCFTNDIRKRPSAKDLTLDPFFQGYIGPDVPNVILEDDLTSMTDSARLNEDK